MNIYLDHNIIDDISKGLLSLKPSDKIVWIFSDENFNEIERSNNKIFLDVLKDLKARKSELILDDNFRITDKARILNYTNPHELYDRYIEATGEVDYDETLNHEFLGRLFGADNQEQILSYPDKVRKQIENILEPYGLYNDDIKKDVDDISNKLSKIAANDLQEIKELEHSRQGLGTHKGRAGILAEEDNPLESIWELLKDKSPGLSADQFYGFGPIDKQGYETWPLFLGVAGCHTVLNFIGFRPDEGLAKVDKLPGILSDGSHIAHGIFTQGIMSQDKRFCAKARAIYKYKNIATKVIHLEQKRC